MSRKNTKNQVRTTDGGTMTFIANENNIGGRIVIERGYKETPTERAERLAAGNRARTFTPGKHKTKGGRSGAKRDALAQW